MAVSKRVRASGLVAAAETAEAQSTADAIKEALKARCGWFTCSLEEEKIVSRIVQCWLAATVVMFSSWVHAEGVGGKCTLELTKQEAMSIPDRDGHILSFVAFQCKNTSSALGDFMDGATFSSWGTGDLTNGTGQTTGYAHLAKGADSTTSRWTGSVVTTPGKDGSPRTVHVGHWNFIGGTGKYKGATGGGVFSCPFISATQCAFEWSGDLGR
jgi:hypothetical protein